MRDTGPYTAVGILSWPPAPAGEEESWPTYLWRAARPAAAYCLFKSGLISPKLRHIVNMAPSPPATLRFHRKIGHCQIELQILADSHIQFCFKRHIATKLHLLKVGFGNNTSLHKLAQFSHLLSQTFFSQSQVFEPSWWSKCLTSRCTARSCRSQCTTSSPPTSSPSSSSSSRTRTTKWGKPARQRFSSCWSKGWWTRQMWRSRWARFNRRQRITFISIGENLLDNIYQNHLTSKLCFEISVKTGWYNLNDCSSVPRTQQ